MSKPMHLKKRGLLQSGPADESRKFVGSNLQMLRLQTEEEQQGKILQMLEKERKETRMLKRMYEESKEEHQKCKTDLLVYIQRYEWQVRETENCKRDLKKLTTGHQIKDDIINDNFYQIKMLYFALFVSSALTVIALALSAHVVYSI